MIASRYRLLAALAAAAYILLGTAPTLQAQSWQWVHEGSGSGNDIVGGVAVDSLGNSYVVGTFEQNIAFGANVFTNGANTGFYLAKYNAAGILQWATAGIGNGAFLNTAIAAGKGGEIFVTGTFRGASHVGIDSVNSGGARTAVFLARFNTNGTVRWMRRANVSSSDASGRGIAVDNLLNCYITGTFRDTCNFDTSRVISRGGTDVYVAKYDRNAVELWARSAGGPGSDEGNAIGVDAAGNSYVAGRFTDTSIFAVDTMLTLGGGDAFVAKFSSTGAPTWATPLGGVFADVANGIAVDAFGNSHVTGSFTDTASFGGRMLVAKGSTDAFLAKVDGVGDVRWAVRMGGATGDAGYAATLDAVGAVYATGFVSDTADFGNVTLPIVPNNADVFVVKYDAGGSYQWVRSAGGRGRDEGRGIALDAGNELRVAGIYSDTAQFVPLSLVSTGLVDAFTAKLGADPTITIGLILDVNFCIGDQFQIPFTTKGVFGKGNYFVAQLSDSSGSFANPVEIGRVFGIGGTTIVAKIPDTTLPGTHYRVRVVSTVPVAISPPNAKALTFFALPKPVVTPAGPLTICAGDTVMLDAGAGFTTYVWNSGEHARRINVRTSGEYTVTVSNERGCAGTSPRVTVTVHTAARPIITRTGPVLESTPALAYQWDKDGVPLAGAVNRTLTPTNFGNYRVTITDSLGCKATSEIYPFTTSQSVAVEARLEGVSLYPHPNGGVFTISFPMNHRGRVAGVIADASGKQVAAWDEETPGGAYVRRVDISDRPAGVYFVRIESDGRRWSGEVVKQ